ncbi:MAG: NAD(P)-binding domain-containing protein [Rhizomicrobium sp.]
MEADSSLGFAGLGVMGQAMARNLLRAHPGLVVWNRSADKAEALRVAGAHVATDATDFFRRARIAILMLADGTAIDAVLGRATPAFARSVAGHIVVQMGTVRRTIRARWTPTSAPRRRLCRGAGLRLARARRGGRNSSRCWPAIPPPSRRCGRCWRRCAARRCSAARYRTR